MKFSTRGGWDSIWAGMEDRVDDGVSLKYVGLIEFRLKFTYSLLALPTPRVLFALMVMMVVVFLYEWQETEKKRKKKCG